MERTTVERCVDCGRYIQEGHIDCNCDKSHPDERCGLTDTKMTSPLEALRDLWKLEN